MIRRQYINVYDDNSQKICLILDIDILQLKNTDQYHVYIPEQHYLIDKFAAQWLIRDMIEENK